MAKLNLGCGPNWKEQYSDYDGLDIIDYGQEYVGEVILILDELMKLGVRFSEIMANHFLEHFDQNQLKRIFNQVYDLLEDGGEFKIVVPHKDGQRAWVLSHKTFWNKQTLRWLEEPDANGVYGFGKWKVLLLVVNARKDIHCLLQKI